MVGGNVMRSALMALMALPAAAFGDNQVNMSPGVTDDWCGKIYESAYAHHDGFVSSSVSACWCLARCSTPSFMRTASLRGSQVPSQFHESTQGRSRLDGGALSLILIGMAVAGDLHAA